VVQYNLALIGFGGVNRALAKLISDKNNQWRADLDLTLNIVAVTDLHLGSVMSPNGIDPRTLLETRFEKGGFAQVSGGSATGDNERIITQAPADIVVEATFTNPDDGEPAVSHCRWALEADRHVVTTNKGPVAHARHHLKALAASRGRHFAYEGTVMSGTPVIRMANTVLAGAEMKGFEGILNGTSNFVLGRMERGLGLAEAVQEAQALGYAEADPTADVEGFDVRLKVVILANEWLGTDLRPSDVECRGLSALTPADLTAASEAGFRWKLIGSATREPDGRIIASVLPRRLPLDHALAGVNGATNAVSIKTEMLGDVTVTGPGAGPIETAYALLSDIIAIHRASTKPALAGEAA
jgi:homoserine dehydrogenase